MERREKSKKQRTAAEGARRPSLRLKSAPYPSSGLLKWAHDVGLGHALELPVRELNDYQQHYRSIGPLVEKYETIGDLLEDFSSLHHHLQRTVDHPLRSFFAHGVLAKQRENWLRQQRERPIPHPKLARFVSLLTAFLETLPAPKPWLAEIQLGFDHSTKIWGSVGRREMSLCLGDWETGRIRLYAESEETQREFGASFVTRIIELAYDPQDIIHRELVEMISHPFWAQLLSEVERRQKAVPSSPDAGRVAWRIEDDLTVSPLLQKKTKRGGLSKGARKKPKWLLGGSVPSFATGTDIRVASAAEILRHDVESHGYFDGRRFALTTQERRAQWLRLFEGLAEHPVVYFGDGTTPVSVRQGAIGIHIGAVSGGFETKVRFQGELRTPAKWLEQDAAKFDSEPFPQNENAGRPLFLAVFEPDELRFSYHVFSEEVWTLLCTLAEFEFAIPAEGIDQVLSTITKISPDTPLELPPTLVKETVPLPPALTCQITPGASEGATVVLGIRVFDKGPFLPPGSGSKTVLDLRQNERRCLLRDFAAENQLAADCAEKLGLSREFAAGGAVVLTRDDAFLSFLESVEPLASLEWPEGQARSVVGKLSTVNVNVIRLETWLGVDGTASVGSHRVTLAQLLRASQKGQRFISLGKGRYARIADQLRTRLADAGASVFETEDKSLGVGFGQAQELFALASSARAIRGKKIIEAAISRMEESLALRVGEPVGVEATFRDYQQEGYVWLRRLSHWGLGGLLADDMGLGKTLQALALCQHRVGEGPVLVVAPTSVVDNWASECARFCPGLSPVVYREKGRRALLKKLEPGQVLITSYDIMVRDEALSQVEFGTFVLDEAQWIKNPKTKRARAAAAIQSKFTLALTGTPIENRLSDLWSIFHVVQPGLLGPWAHFRSRYVIPIERDHDARALSRLVRLVQPFLLRRTKDAVAKELPPRTDVTEKVELTPGEQTIYDAARNDAAERLAEARTGDKEAAPIQVLAELTKLRQLACHPRLVDPTSKIESAKMNRLSDLVHELVQSDHRTLVFSQFTQHLKLARARLEGEQVSCLYLDGSTRAAARRTLIRTFQSGSHSVFLISLKAGGTGLNLTAADYVVHLDPWWNPAVEDQASDRAHRIGQDRPVTVIRLVSRGTVEDVVTTMHEQKRQLARDVLSGTNLAGRMTAKEMISLIQGGVR